MECTVSRNHAGSSGGGIDVWNSSATLITGCSITGNAAVEDGGGIYCWRTSPTVESCVLAGNSTSGGGGGIYCFDGSDPSITGCTLSGNGAQEGGGGIFCSGSSPMLANSIVAFSTEGQVVSCTGNSVPSLTCCDVFGNAGGDWVECIENQYGINGNISEDPLFCDPENGDFTLQDCSPCAPFSPPNPECDLIGAWPVGCGGSPAVETTWGGVKALFRE